MFVLDMNDNVFLLGMDNGVDVSGGTAVTGVAKADMTGFTFDELDKIMENNPIFKAPNDMIADINTDSIQAPNSSVKMMQLFFTTETEKKFREMVKELQEEYNKTNVTDTVFTIVEKEYKLYKDEK